jgi:phage recombination protein Bet
MPRPKFISVAQCAREFGVSESFIRKLVDAKKIRHIRLGKRFLIPADEAELLQQLTHQPSEPEPKEKDMGTSLIERMADKRHLDPQTYYRTVKQTLMPSNATDEQIAAFLMIADRYNLDPLTREIFAFPNRKGSGITPVLSIDGWINLVNSHPQADGFSFRHEKDEEGRLISMTCTMHRKDRTHPVEVTEFYQENYRATEPWNQMPSRMLRHKAFKEAARLAFGFAGIADEDEARDMGERPIVLERVADNVVDALDAFAAGSQTVVDDEASGNAEDGSSVPTSPNPAAAVPA